MGRLSERKNAGTAFDAKLVIFVEGETDEPILSRLLDSSKLQDISFKHDPKGNVIEKVRENIGREEVDGEICFGIVDRDTLNKRANDLALFLEPDDEVFLEKRPFGPRVHVLLRWEIENYVLLDAEAVGKELDDLHAPKEVSRVEVRAILERLIALGDSQVPLIAACLASVEDSGPHVFGENGLERWNWEMQSREQIETAVDSKGFAWRTHVAKVERMHAGDEADVGQRWRAMNRLVDGKRILSQLCKKRRTERDQLRARLARAHQTYPVVSSELGRILEGFRREARTIAQARSVALHTVD